MKSHQFLFAILLITIFLSGQSFTVNNESSSPIKWIESDRLKTFYTREGLFEVFSQDHQESSYVDLSDFDVDVFQLASVEESQRAPHNEY